MSIGDIFRFVEDIGNYADRVVGRYDAKELSVSTARVSDGGQPYETAVQSPRYNGGKWVIVQAYNTKQDAKAGHLEWVNRMKTDPPTVLQDCANSTVSELLGKIGGTMDFETGE